MKIGTGHSNLAITHTFTRAKGFPYWTYSCVRQSSCGVRFELGDRVTIARGPCVILIRPGTAYRLSYAGTGRRWIEDYALFAPRPEWLRLMDWPTLLPEIGCLQLDRSPASRNYIRALANLHPPIGTPQREELQYNALERLLLLSAAINPQSGAAKLDPRIRATIDHLAGHLAEQLSIDTLAEAIHLSPSHFAHLFREQTGESPMHFLERLRMRHACDLLISTDRAIEAIAREVGFENAFHFSTRFRKRIGQSPREYRKRPAG